MSIAWVIEKTEMHKFCSKTRICDPCFLYNNYIDFMKRNDDYILIGICHLKLYLIPLPCSRSESEDNGKRWGISNWN